MNLVMSGGRFVYLHTTVIPTIRYVTCGVTCNMDGDQLTPPHSGQQGIFHPRISLVYDMTRLYIPCIFLVNLLSEILW